MRMTWKIFVVALVGVYISFFIREHRRKPSHVVPAELVVARACGPDCLELNGRYCATDTPLLLGNCPGEGIAWNKGPRLKRGANGWFKVTFNGVPAECGLSLADCNDSHHPTEKYYWAGNEYSSRLRPAIWKGGPYLGCIMDTMGDDYCDVDVMRNPGNVPTPLGNSH